MTAHQLGIAAEHEVPIRGFRHRAGSRRTVAAAVGGGDPPSAGSGGGPVLRCALSAWQSLRWTAAASSSRRVPGEPCGARPHPLRRCWAAEFAEDVAVDACGRTLCAFGSVSASWSNQGIVVPTPISCRRFRRKAQLRCKHTWSRCLATCLSTPTCVTRVRAQPAGGCTRADEERGTRAGAFLHPRLRAQVRPIDQLMEAVSSYMRRRPVDHVHI